jgi:hypothetical protein
MVICRSCFGCVLSLSGLVSGDIQGFCRLMLGSACSAVDSEAAGCRTSFEGEFTGFDAFNSSCASSSATSVAGGLGAPVCSRVSFFDLPTATRLITPLSSISSAAMSEDECLRVDTSSA